MTDVRSAADLWLELGDAKQAKSLIVTAAKEGDRGLMKGLADFTVGPVMVGVLVRCGEVDRVFGILQAADDESRVCWTTLGMFCAATGKTGVLEKRLDTIQSARVKTDLCIGAADAFLMEHRNQRGAGPGRT